jgi:hypothetical protein
VQTGIPAQTWLMEDPAIFSTAVEILVERNNG